MATEKIIMFKNRLEKVYKHLSRHAKRLGVSCYRVYDHDLPEVPLCIEIYDGKVYVAEYRRRHKMSEQEHDQWWSQALEVIAGVVHVGTEDVFLKLRQKKVGRAGQYQKIAAARREFVVDENGLKFIVNLSDYLDTGLFLDHRLTRQIVREEAEGKKVLNLFAYTGSFSVYAAAGGAMEVTSVDLSNTYLNWARRNMELNGFSEQSKYSFVQTDVKKYLRDISKNCFDIVIMDPPTFSNSKRIEGWLDIQADHVELINQCVAVLDKRGILYFSTNSNTFQLYNDKIGASVINDITKATTPFDFEGKLSRQCYVISK